MKNSNEYEIIKNFQQYRSQLALEKGIADSDVIQLSQVIDGVI